jgi:hypothetical protein
MTNFELQNYIRNEYRNDRSWLLAIEKDRKTRTRVGVVDLIVYVLGQRHARKACC